MKTFLQTKSWLKFQESVGNKTWRFDDQAMTANIIKQHLPFGRSYLYLPHGPSIDLSAIKSGLKNEVKDFIGEIITLAKQEKAIFIKVEPLQDTVMELLYRRGFRLSGKSVQPQRTIIVDLSGSEAEILGRMHHKTRYNINLSEKKGLSIEESQDAEAFIKILKKTAKADNFSTHPDSYYKKMLEFFKNDQEVSCHLFLVKLQDKIVAGEIVAISGQEAYYLHGAMDRNFKEMMAPYFMHWEIIKWLKSKGVKQYDFWGVDSRRWPGVTRFKSGWGGQLVERPGSFDLPISRSWFLAYRLIRKIFRKQ